MFIIPLVVGLSRYESCFSVCLSSHMCALVFYEELIHCHMIYDMNTDKYLYSLIVLKNNIKYK